MITWYMPTWHGDLRVVQAGATTCELVLHRPTPLERAAAEKIVERCKERGWCDAPIDLSKRKVRYLIHGAMAEVGPIVSQILRPGEAVLTAVVFKDGHVETSSKSEGPSLEELTTKALTPYREPSEPPDPEKEATALATVKRPTPCCPQCKQGAIEPATEALLAFLTPAQHAQWAADRTLVVQGGLSGIRYLLAHRNSATAERFGKMCYDLDHQQIIHFHDNSVPPEEEVLAAKLILEHREPWLRNEATCFGAMRYKNPFGDAMDGVWDAELARSIGRIWLRGLTLA